MQTTLNTISSYCDANFSMHIGCQCVYIQLCSRLSIRSRVCSFGTWRFISAFIYTRVIYDMFTVQRAKTILCYP